MVLRRLVYSSISLFGGLILQPDLIHPKKKQRICNFKAPDDLHFQDWKRYSKYVQGLGLDVCRVTIGLCRAFMSGEEVATIRTPQKIVNLQMNNSFLYQVQKPRRTPYSLNCIKPEFRKTFSSILFEAYVLEKARRLRGEFCFRDFLEIKYDAFRRIVVRLKRKGLIVANPVRSIPRFYILSEFLDQKNFKKT